MIPFALLLRSTLPSFLKGKLQGYKLIIFIINRHSINQEIASSISCLAKHHDLVRTNLTFSPDLQMINTSLNKYGVTLQSLDPEVDNSQKLALSNQSPIELSSLTTALKELSPLMTRAGN